MKTILSSLVKIIFTTSLMLLLNVRVYSQECLIATLETMTPPTCFNGTNGNVSISLSGNGASSNGTYIVDNQQQTSFSSNPFTVPGLSAGIHSISISTNLECTVTLPFEVLSPNNPDDNNACTIDGCNPIDGSISHIPVIISDNNACTIDACNTVTGVSHTTIPISDGNACTTDACITSSGTITHVLVNPNDGNACTTDGCNAVTGIFHVLIPVNDNNQCTIDACNTLTGQVSHTVFNISDGNICTTDFCDAVTGIIAHVVINVNDNNPCTSDGCNTSIGVFHDPISVNDNNACTLDGCSSSFGVYHLYFSISDNNACTIDACDPLTGTVTNIPFNIDDNNPCTIDYCNATSGTVFHIPADINDNNPCTVDGCNIETGVFHFPLNIDDNNICTVDFCNLTNGQISHIPLNINDNNPCTIDGCNNEVGVFHFPVNIDDNNICTVDNCNSTNGFITHINSSPVVVVLPGTISCYAGGTCIDVVAGGGFPPYSGTGNFCDYGAGNYSFDVTDSHGCTVTKSVTITEPAKLFINVSTTNEGCGMSDGTATANVFGGTPPFSFLWSPGSQTTKVATGLNAGTYNVSVTDANGCTASASANIFYSEGPPSTPGSISGPGSVCKSKSGVVYCVPPQQDATSYMWILPLGVTAIGTTNGPCITLRFNGQFKGGFVCVKAMNGCGVSATSCKNIVLLNNPPSTPGLITGPTFLCPFSLATYSIQNVPGASGYQWEVKNGLILISGQGTNSIVVQAKAGFFFNSSVRVRAINCKGTTKYRSLGIIVGFGCIESAKVPRKEISQDVNKSLQDFSVYPNPSNGKFTLDIVSDHSGKMTMQLSDLVGRVLMIEDINVNEGNNKKEINAEGLSRGMYFISILSEGRESRVMNIILE